MPCSPRGFTSTALLYLALVALVAVAVHAETAPASTKKEQPKSSKATKAKSKTSSKKPKTKKEAFPSRYTSGGLRLEYPTLDEGLLGVLAGGPPPSQEKAARVAAEMPGKIQPILGDVVRRPDEPIVSQPTMTQEAQASVDASIPSTMAAALGRPPLPPPNASPMDVKRYADLYRKDDQARGWLGYRSRSDYVRVAPETTRTDRWRMGFPDYTQHTRSSGPLDPYDQNILKGDYPIIGDRTFLVLTGISDTVYEERHLPTPSNIPALLPGSFNTFGRPGQHAFKQIFSFTANVFNGDTGFEPPRWQLRLTPVFNVKNDIRLQEVGNINPDVRRGTDRDTFDIAFQELFAEIRLAVHTPFFDFTSMRLGRQFFNSDFRGFIFSNFNQGIRLFGNGAANRNSYNVVYFDMVEYETNSELMRSDPNPDRGQGVFMANFFRQDFANIPGYTLGVNYHSNRDDPSFLFDTNGFLVRPDPVGRFRPHKIDTNYFGLVGDGHIGWLNLTHAFYHVSGEDSFNNLAGQRINVDANMAAVEASVDRDWLRYKTSLFWSSGDSNPTDNQGKAFDSILDDVNFAGGQNSFWVRQGLRLQGVGLKQRISLIPDLRSSKLQGQANHVNPGLQLFNVGVDIDATPKLKLILNANFLRFDKTEPLQLFLFQKTVPAGIGTDYSIAANYRPALNQNIVIDLGVAGFMPSDGFTAIYASDKGLYQAFTNVKLTF